MTYTILLYADIIDQMVTDSLETSRNSLKRSVSGPDNAVLKWSGSKPASFPACTEYNQSGIQTEMDKVEWKVTPS